MLKVIGQIFGRYISDGADNDPMSREHSVQLATALLLVEVARADYSVDLTEDQAILAMLKEYFELSDREAEELIMRAKSEADHAASLQSFTRQLHEELNREEKQRIVEMLWRVAMADDYLDKHEDHLVRKVAGLLYVSHSDLIRIRNRVRGQ